MAQLQEKLQIEVSAAGTLREDFDLMIRDAERASEALSAAFEKATAGNSFDALRKQAEESYAAIVRGAKAVREQIDRSLSASPAEPGSRKVLTDVSREFTNIDRAAAETSRGVTRFGQQFASSFGPAGQTIGNVTTEVANLGGGLDAIIAKSGLSAAALGGIGVALGAVVAVGSALNEAVEMSERLDSKLGGLAARQGDYAQAQESYKAIVRARSSASGTPDDQVADAFKAVSESFPKQSDQDAIVKAAIDAAVAGQGELVSIARQTAESLKQFKLPASDAAGFLNKIFIVSKEAGGSIESLTSPVVKLAREMDALGVSFDDTLALIGSARKSGASLDDLGQSISRAFALLRNPSDRKSALEEIAGSLELGQDAAAGFINALDRIKTAARAVGGDQALQRAIGGSGSRSALAAFQADADTFRKLRASFVVDQGALERQALAAQNDAGGRLARSRQEFLNDLSRIGDAVNEAKAAFAGADIKLPEIVLQTPDSLKSLSDRISQALSSGDESAAQKALVELRALGARSGEEYAKALSEAVNQRVDRDLKSALELQSRQSFNRGEVAPDAIFDRSKSEQVARAALEPKRAEFFSTIQSIIELNEKAVAAQSIKVPVSVEPKVSVDKLGSDIDRALAELSRANVQLPVSVEFAKKDLERIQNLRTVDGVRRSSAVLELTGDKEKAQNDVAAVNAFIAAERQLQGIISQVGVRSASGFDAQVAQIRQVETAVKSTIDEIKAAGVASSTTIGELESRLESLRSANDSRVQELAAKNVATVEAQILALKVQSLEKARDTAALQRDTTRADSLGVEIVEARAEAQAAANRVQLAALRVQYAGQKDIEDSLQRVAFLMNEQVQASRLLGIEDEKKASRERARAVAERTRLGLDRVDALRGETLIGLDAELEKINRNRRAREAADRRDIAGGNFAIPTSDFERVVEFYNQIEQRDLALARRNSALASTEAIANALGQVTGQVREQIAAIELARGVERLRFEDTLRSSGISLSLQNQQLALFDQLTAQQREATTIAFANQSATAIAETRLLADAYREAAKASELLGESSERAFDRQVRAVTQAREGVEALTAGYRAGVTDAIRSLNDFNQGAEAGRNRVIGFRDSIVEALDSVGEKGKSVGDILRGVVVSNLRNLQKEVATRAANSLTKAVFGEQAANTPEDRLAGAGSTLQTAGDRLLASAQALDQAALRFNAGATNALPQGFSQDTASGVLSLPLGVQGPTASGEPLLGGQQGPNPDGSTADGAAALTNAGSTAGDSITGAGNEFSSIVTAGARRSATSIVAGGQNFLASFLSGAGDKLGGVLGKFLTKGLTSAATGGGENTEGMEHGGVFSGLPVRQLSPLANRLGGTYRQRTLIEVAEVPGLEEAVIPMQGGAIPVSVRGPKPGPRRMSEMDRVLELMSRPQPDGRLQRAIDAGPSSGDVRRARATGAGSSNRAVRVTNAPTVHMNGGINIEIHAAPGMDEAALARKVASMIDERAPKAVRNALNSGSDRKTIEAVRSAVH